MKAILIHGAGATNLSWVSVLHKVPHPFITTSYNVHDSFEKILKDVEHYLPTSDEKYVVIGHSFGGIVAYHLAQKRKDIIAGMSIATPWGGSSIAQLSSFFWKSQFCKNIGRYEQHMKTTRSNSINIPWLNIVTDGGLFGSESDGVVTVASQKEIAPSSKVEMIKLHNSHNEVLHCDQLIKETNRWLMNFS
jgi:pimeloyl-ACP methyl ester carboxylesterase